MLDCLLQIAFEYKLNFGLSSYVGAYSSLHGIKCVILFL